KPYSKPYSKPYIEKEDKSSKNKKFEKPTIAEIENYCKEINSNINAHNFYDFYESKGWLIGKNPMKCWKACVRTWERNTKGVKSDAGFTSNKLVTEVDSRENATRNKATVDKWGIETNRL
ncbi:MAG: hypothetical protein RR923_03055, partial [Bacilli bacterium]